MLDGVVWHFLSYVFREAELDDDTELFVGPPPPAMVSEAESANEAERFEEVFNPNCILLQTNIGYFLVVKWNRV